MHDGLDHRRAIGGRDDARPSQRGDHQHAQLPADLELLAGQRARHHAQVDRVEFDALHAHQLRRVQQQVLQLEGRAIAFSDTPCSTSFTWLRSAVVGTGMSMTARAQSLDRFTVLTICPLGMVNTSPSDDRSLVTRSVTSSTVPRGLLGDTGDRQRDQVTEAVLLFGDDEEPRQQVLHDALCAEAQRGAQHRGGRHQRADRDRRGCR